MMARKGLSCDRGDGLKVRYGVWWRNQEDYGGTRKRASAEDCLLEINRMVTRNGC
jgi:hypothetical protein